MTRQRTAALFTPAVLVACLLLAGCASLPPAATDGPTLGPTIAPTAGQPMPIPTLDPDLSDAGVAALVTLPDDTHGGRTGTHVIVGARAAGSSCSTSLDGEEFTAVAWVDDAANGQLARLSVTVPASDVPAEDGATTDIDARVSFDFMSESGIGTLYTGDSSEEDAGHSTIDVIRAGDLLTFLFEGETWADVAFLGQALCRIG